MSTRPSPDMIDGQELSRKPSRLKRAANNTAKVAAFALAKGTVLLAVASLNNPGEAQGPVPTRVEVVQSDPSGELVQALQLNDVLAAPTPVVLARTAGGAVVLPPFPAPASIDRALPSRTPTPEPVRPIPAEEDELPADVDLRLVSTFMNFEADCVKSPTRVRSATNRLSQYAGTLLSIMVTPFDWMYPRTLYAEPLNREMAAVQTPEQLKSCLLDIESKRSFLTSKEQASSRGFSTIKVENIKPEDIKHVSRAELENKLVVDLQDKLPGINRSEVQAMLAQERYTFWNPATKEIGVFTPVWYDKKEDALAAQNAGIRRARWKGQMIAYFFDKETNQLVLIEQNDDPNKTCDNISVPLRRPVPQPPQQVVPPTATLTQLPPTATETARPVLVPVTPSATPTQWTTTNQPTPTTPPATQPPATATERPTQPPATATEVPPTATKVPPTATVRASTVPQTRVVQTPSVEATRLATSTPQPTEEEDRTPIPTPARPVTIPQTAVAQTPSAVAANVPVGSPQPVGTESRRDPNAAPTAGAAAKPAGEVTTNTQPRTGTKPGENPAEQPKPGVSVAAKPGGEAPAKPAVEAPKPAAKPEAPKPSGGVVQENRNNPPGKPQASAPVPAPKPAPVAQQPVQSGPRTGTAPSKR